MRAFGDEYDRLGSLVPSGFIRTAVVYDSRRSLAQRDLQNDDFNEFAMGALQDTLTDCNF